MPRSIVLSVELLRESSIDFNVWSINKMAIVFTYKAIISGVEKTNNYWLKHSQKKGGKYYPAPINVF